MKAYSTDLRERIIKAWQAGQPQSAIADHYAVSLSTVKRLIRQYKQTGHVEAKQRTHWSRKIGTVAQRAALEDQLAAHSDSTIAQHLARWAEAHQAKISYSTMWRAIQGLNWTHKKRRSMPVSKTRRNAPPLSNT
jgi:transposase